MGPGRSLRKKRKRENMKKKKSEADASASGSSQKEESGDWFDEFCKRSNGILYLLLLLYRMYLLGVSFF